VPVPDVSKGFCRIAQSIHAGDTALTLHGVVFDILAWGARTASRKREKAPLFGGASALAQFRFELAISLGIGVLALTARVLLLLARLLTAALLLTGLLARVLILLARVLVEVAHSESPLLNATRQRADPAPVSQELRFHRDHCVTLSCRQCGFRNPGSKTSLVQAR
jgi:hypothetical protein